KHHPRADDGENDDAYEEQPDPFLAEDVGFVRLVRHGLTPPLSRSPRELLKRARSRLDHRSVEKEARANRGEGRSRSGRDADRPGGWPGSRPTGRWRPKRKVRRRGSSCGPRATREDEGLPAWGSGAEGSARRRRAPRRAGRHVRAARRGPHLPGPEPTAGGRVRHRRRRVSRLLPYTGSVSRKASATSVSFYRSDSSLYQLEPLSSMAEPRPISDGATQRGRARRRGGRRWLRAPRPAVPGPSAARG